jgi:hypothetical protein
LLASADVNATLRLALRSPLDPIGPARSERFKLPTAPLANRAAAVLPQPAAPVFVAAPPAAAPVAVPPPRARSVPARNTVEVIEEQTSPSAGP